MPLTLYGHAFSSYTWKVLIALHENATPFEFRQVGPDQPAHTAEWLRRWPLRKFPLLVDGGRDVVETSIIIEYLQLAHPGPAQPGQQHHRQQRLQGRSGHQRQGTLTSRRHFHAASQQHHREQPTRTPQPPAPQHPVGAARAQPVVQQLELAHRPAQRNLHGAAAPVSMPANPNCWRCMVSICGSIESSMACRAPASSPYSMRLTSNLWLSRILSSTQGSGSSIWVL